SRAPSEEARAEVEAGLAEVCKRLSPVAPIAFFGAPRRPTLEGLITVLEQRIPPAPSGTGVAPARPPSLPPPPAHTWVTRKGIHIDRIACAWLIRKFIDEDAAFKFVPARGYTPGPRELRFDMFDAEFTHDGELCSFEVMLRAFALTAPALHAIAEV